MFVVVVDWSHPGLHRQVANNLNKGEQLISKTLNENVPFFSELFEVGRSAFLYGIFVRANAV